MLKRKIFTCVSLKVLTVFCSLGGVIISLVNAKKDGYSHYLKRLLYFTAQSNIWLGVTFLLILFLPFIKACNNERFKNILYLLKYAFTVSITVTALVFCCFLAPFSPSDYKPWTLSGFLTHVFSPLFAIADYFFDNHEIKFKHYYLPFSLLPPLIYLICASVLSILGVDFGRGVNYPYFFLNFFSPVGFFGFSNQKPFVIGSFYYLVILTIIILFLGYIFAKLK